jgi:hypothetical protein
VVLFFFQPRYSTKIIGSILLNLPNFTFLLPKLPNFIFILQNLFVIIIRAVRNSQHLSSIRKL